MILGYTCCVLLISSGVAMDFLDCFARETGYIEL